MVGSQVMPVVSGHGGAVAMPVLMGHDSAEAMPVLMCLVVQRLWSS